MAPDAGTVPLAEPGASDRSADGQLKAGQRPARGHGHVFLQVAAIAAVSALLTVLSAGNVSISVRFGDHATLSPPAAAAASPSSLLPAPAPSTAWNEGGAAAGRKGRARSERKGMMGKQRGQGGQEGGTDARGGRDQGEASKVPASKAYDAKGMERKQEKRAKKRQRSEDERHRGYTSEYVFDASSTDPKYLSQIWPTIILIGVQKGGTSSVAGQIMAHSAVCQSKKGKETHFHDARGEANAYAKVFGTDPKCSRDIRPGDREQAMTQHPILAGKVHLGGRHFEGTPKLFHGASSLKRFVTSIPKALKSHLKFVLILREPISRDLSAYNHMRRIAATMWACPSNEDVLKSSNDYNAYLRTFVGCWKDSVCSSCSKSIVDRGNYQKHLTRWLKAFDRRQFFVLQSDMVHSGAPRELVQDTLQRLGSFLGLSGPEWQKLSADGLRQSNSKTSDSFRAQNIDPELCRQMQAYYGPRNAQLYKLLRDTKAAAPPEQPDFLEFKDACKSAGASPAAELLAA